MTRSEISGAPSAVLQERLAALTAGRFIAAGMWGDLEREKLELAQELARRPFVSCGSPPWLDVVREAARDKGGQQIALVLDGQTDLLRGDA